MDKKCLIFDMDGTLVDSIKGITGAINAARDEVGLSPIGTDMVDKYINVPYVNLAKIFYDLDDYNEGVKEIFYKYYIKECTKNLSFYDGIFEFLRQEHKNYKIAIATNAHDLFAIKMMKSLNAHHFFDAIVGANTAGASKPDKKMICYILNLLDAKQKDTLLIGDSQKDEIAAKNSDIHFLYANWGYGNYECKDFANCQNSTNLHECIKKIF